MNIAPIFYELKHMDVSPCYDRYNVRFKPKFKNMDEIEDLSNMYTLCVQFCYDDETYIVTSNPGFQITIYSNHTTDYPVPNPVLWWAYQAQRTHVTLMQHAFFGHNSNKGTNFYYMLKDLNFVDDWLWDNALHQCQPFRSMNEETMSFVENIRAYLQRFNKDTRQQKMTLIIDQMELFISNNDIASQSIDEGLMRTILRDLMTELPDLEEETLFL